MPKGRDDEHDICSLYHAACRTGSFTKLDEELAHRVFAAIQPGDILTSLAYAGLISGMAWDLARTCRARKYSPVYFNTLFEQLLKEYA